jgi:hypothetical protein
VRACLAVLAILLGMSAQAQPRGRIRPTQPSPGVVFRLLPAAGGGSLDCAAQLQGSFGETISITRATTQSCTKGGGTVVSLSSGQPAVEPAGFLSEAAATNLALRSAELDNATWTKIGSGDAPTVTANTEDVADPLGTNTAEKVAYPAVSGASAYALLRQTITTTAVAHTSSVYLRTASGTATVWLGLSGANSATECAVTTSWTRCTCTQTATAAARNLDIGVNRFETNQADQPAQTVYVWGAQLEALNHASSYIATAGTSATRNVTVSSVAKPSDLSVNYLLRSAELDNAAWTVVNSAAVTADTWDFGYGQTGETLEDDSAALNEGLRQSYATTATGAYTASCHFQAGTATAARFIVGATGGTATPNTITVSGLSAATERREFTFVASGSVTAIVVEIHVGTGASSTGTIKVGGCQLNYGSTAGAYVATGAATRTQGEGCFSTCITPGWTGGDIDRVYLSGSAASSDRFVAYAVLDQYRAFNGTTVAAVAAGYTAGVTKCYRTQWSEAANSLRVTNIASGATGSNTFSGFTAFEPILYFANRNGLNAQGSLRISDVRLGSSWEACE